MLNVMHGKIISNPAAVSLPFIVIRLLWGRVVFWNQDPNGHWWLLLI